MKKRRTMTQKVLWLKIAIEANHEKFKSRLRPNSFIRDTQASFFYMKDIIFAIIRFGNPNQNKHNKVDSMRMNRISTIALTYLVMFSRSNCTLK